MGSRLAVPILKTENPFGLIFWYHQYYSGGGGGRSTVYRFGQILRYNNSHPLACL